ncbi:MAG TPA: hypothetical protein VGH21_08385 [Solirubrobacteraceae bacterium]
MRGSLLRLLVLSGAATIVIAGCGKGGATGHSTARLGSNPPPEARGVVGVSTKNTTRLGGADPAADAAAVAQAIYPGITPATRPQTVALVDQHDWPAALAASSLAGAPLGAALLYTDGDTLPQTSEAALRAMRPLGSSALGGAQVLSIGTRTTAPGNYKVKAIAGSAAATGGGSAQATNAGAAATAGAERAASAAVEVLGVLQAAAGHRPHEVIVVATDTPQALQMPAAELAAEGATPILFVTSSDVPAATSQALKSLEHPTIYVIAPKTLHATAYAALAKLGTVVHVSGEAGPGENAAAHASDDPVENAISVSRFSHGAFGWGIHEAGHGLVFANVARPLDAPAAAPLSAHGDYGPLLLLEHAASVPTALTHYFSNIEPGYTAAAPPVREVYNHGWLIGDEQAISALAQAELDTVLEIAPRQPSAGEQSVAEAE